MSDPCQWKISLRYRKEGEDEPVVLEFGSSHSGDDDAQISAMECIAQDLACLLCALHALGRVVPSPGEDVLEAFGSTLDETYGYWKKKNADGPD